MKSAQPISRRLCRSAVKNADRRHRRLLCARRERPRCRAADKRDKLAPPHALPLDRGVYSTTFDECGTCCASQQKLSANVRVGVKTRSARCETSGQLSPQQPTSERIL